MKHMVGIVVLIAAGFGGYFLYKKYLAREDASKASDPGTDNVVPMTKGASKPGMGGKKPMASAVAKNKAVAATDGKSAEWKGVPYR